MPYESELAEALTKLPISAKVTYLCRNAEIDTTGPDGKPWEYFEWHIELRCEDRTMIVPSYKTGTGLAKRRCYNGQYTQQQLNTGRHDLSPSVTVKPTAPTLADVMHSLLSDSDALDYPFAEWAENYGLGSDSIKALNTYLQCQRYGTQLTQLIGTQRIEELRGKEH